MSKQTLNRGALICGSALLLALSVSGAHAFTEEPVNIPQGQTEAPAAAVVQPGASAVQLQDPSSSAPKGGETEVTIPGLGTVGVIPKLDFGLELLYGAKETPGALPEPTQAKDGELQIRGTIRHRF